MILDVADVAKLLRVPESWVYNHARNGTLPAFKLGHYWRFDRRTLLRWIADRAVANCGRR